MVWHLDVGSSHPGAVAGPKGWAVRPLKRGCTINLVKNDLHDKFVEEITERFEDKYGHAPMIYDVVISDGAHKLED